MKICFISHSPNLGGGERSMLFLLKTLKQIPEIELLVILPNHGPLEDNLKELKIPCLIEEYEWWTVRRGQKRKSLKTDFPYHFQKALYLKTKLEEEKIDLIVTNTSVICEGALVAYMLKIPHIWHVRELGEKDHGFVFKFGFAFTAKFINQFSSLVIFNSKVVMNEFSKYVSKNKSKVIYNCVEIDNELIQTETDIKYNYQNTFKLLIAGTISRKKGQIDALKATSYLLKKGINVELVVLGNCTDILLREEICEIIKNCPKTNHIHLYSFVNNPYPVFNQCDTVLVCSKNEAFGRTILEGMLLKKAVIATNSGGVPEIIKDKDNGLLYPPGKYKILAEKILQLISNSKLKRSLEQKGYFTARTKFSNNHYSFQLLKQFQKTKKLPRIRKQFKKRLNFPDNFDVI